VVTSSSQLPSVNSHGNFLGQLLELPPIEFDPFDPVPADLDLLASVPHRGLE